MTDEGRRQDRSTFGQYPCRYVDCKYVAPYVGARSAHEEMRHGPSDTDIARPINVMDFAAMYDDPTGDARNQR